VVDAANVVGSRPDGWWRDRAAATARLVDGLRQAVRRHRLPSPIVVVVEGRARGGVATGSDGGVTVVHAAAVGDDAIVDQVTASLGAAVGPGSTPISAAAALSVAAPPTDGPSGPVEPEPAEPEPAEPGPVEEPGPAEPELVAVPGPVEEPGPVEPGWAACGWTAGVVVVTADRALGRRVRALGASVVGPSWLWQRLGR
jgi:hypothetical protein